MKPVEALALLLVHMITTCTVAWAFSFVRSPPEGDFIHRLARNNLAGTIKSNSFARNNLKGERSSLAGASISEEDANDLSVPYYSYLLSQFQGDFDNYDQVVNDRRHGLTPGEGGGHEHIHCTLVPFPLSNITGDDQSERSQWVLAAFYFNGDPSRIFRFRAYQLSSPSFDETMVRMKLHTLRPHLEQRLRQCPDPCAWWNESCNVWCEQIETQNKVEVDEERWFSFRSAGVSTLVHPLEGCDVLWNPNWDPSKHSYLYVNEYDGISPERTSSVHHPSLTKPVLPIGRSCQATMEAGSKGAIVDSVSLIPGKRILIKDELSLWEDEFWINDRGYDPDAALSDETKGDMPFVYGNRRGVPYKLRRVTEILPDVIPQHLLKRTFVNSDLEWTLGEDYRTIEFYQGKMDAVDVTLR
ncbi:hypothetical protein ACHAWF_011742 [Thalassiosira exigua]